MDLDLSAGDLDLLDNVITVIPILRVVAAIGKEARKRRLRYPVTAVEQLQACLGEDTLRYGDHRIDHATIAHGIPESWFPIAHEGELMSRVHMALLRCEMESAAMAPRPTLEPR